MSNTSDGVYVKAGVNYGAMDPIKRLAQLKAKSTSNNLESFGMREIEASRGESAYVWEEDDSYRALVVEGLGTKNIVADHTRKITSKTYYDSLAQDTVAMIVNDLVVVGAAPQVVNAYFAVGNSNWFNDKKRAGDLVKGWAKACDLAGATWGGGETPTLKGIIEPKTIDLSGAAIGIIKPKTRLVLGEKINEGDRIILIESSGIHANGLTLARAIVKKLKKGYATKLSNGNIYGEALLRPTHIYAKFVQELFEANVDVHYMINVTGHGWRKIIRARQDHTYVIEKTPPLQEEFRLIQKIAEMTEKDLYATFNCGVGFVVIVEGKEAKTVVSIAKKSGFKAWNAGRVEKGPKRLIVESKNIIFESESMNIR